MTSAVKAVNAYQFLAHPLYEQADNLVAGPIALPKLDMVDATDFGKIDRSKGLDLTSPLLPGVSLHVAPGSAMTMGGRPFAGKLTLTNLPVDKLREVLPPGVVPGSLFVGVDGPDLMFSTPAQITLPNTVGYAAGGILNLMTLNMTTGGFDVTGHLKVSADGKRLEPLDGGLTGSSCVTGVPRPPGNSDTGTCGCQTTAGGLNGGGGGGGLPSGGVQRSLLDSDAGLVTGEYLQDHPLVPYQSQGQGRTLDLQYSSLQADPRPVVQVVPTTQPYSLSDSVGSVTAGAKLAGVIQGSQVAYAPPNLADDQRFRVPLQLDGTQLVTGRYPYAVTVTGNYTGGGPSLSAEYDGTVNVVNAAAGPYGAGWSVGGLQRVYAGPAGAVVTAGSQGTEFFSARAAGAINDLAVLAGGGYYQGGTTRRLLSNDGTGMFTVPAAGLVQAGSVAAATAGDFNGDGYADLAQAAGSAVIIATATAAGGFAAGASYSLPSTAVAIVTGNFFGHADGTLDLAVLRADGVVSAFPGNGNGTFGTRVDTTVGSGALANASSSSLAAGDFNGDGRTDLAVAAGVNGQAYVLLGGATGGFTASAVATPGLSNVARVAAGRFSGGTAFDLAVGTGGDEHILMLTGNGAGGFTAAGLSSPFSNGYFPSGFAAGDFYGTGRDDVAFFDPDVLSVVIVPGLPGGSWGQPVGYPIPGAINYSATKQLCVGDFNGDGKASLAMVDGQGPLRLLLSNPDTNQMEPWAEVAGVNAAGVAAAGHFTARSLPARYMAPMGNTSALARNGNGTWTHSYADGAVVRFDAAGRETAEADRNGNTTSYAYVATGPAAGALQSVTDPVGLITTLAYDAAGHLSTITDPAGRVTSFTVDGNGNLTRVVDPDGAVTGYGYAAPSNHRITTETNPDNHAATAHYDAFGRLAGETLFDGTSVTSLGAGEERGLLAPGGSGPLPLPAGFQGSVTDQDGHTTVLTFDAMTHPSAVTDPLGNTTTYARDMNGWPLSVTDPLNRTTSYVHDMMGNVTRVTRPDQSYETIAYDPTYNVPTQITDFRGLITTFTLDARGNVLRRTDPDLLHEDFTYTASGQLLTDTDRNGHTTTDHYDALGRPDQVTFPGATSPAIHLGYDAAGDVLTMTDELGHITTMTYDAAGRVLTTQDPVQAAAGQSTAYAYDPAGNETSMTDVLGHLTTRTYDARNRPIGMVDAFNQGSGRQVTFAYDPASNLMSVTDPLGHATSYSYDADNRRTGTTDALNHATAYAYDPAGQLTSVTDANNNATAYAYDSLGRLQSTTLPSATTPSPLIWTYGYDADNNPTSVTNPLTSGPTRTYGYDNLNRRTSATTWPDPYSPLTTTFGYDAAGNLTSVADPLGHAITTIYDEHDRPTSRTAPAGGGTTSYAYDAHSRLLSVTDPVNNVTSYGYDNADRATTVTDPRNKVTTTVYDLVGNPTQVTDRDGRVRQFAHDVDNRPTSEAWARPGGGTPLDTFTTAYDAAGRVTSVGDANSQYAYGYDNADRTTSVDDLGTPGLPRVVLTYGYDNAGNRTGLSDTLGGRYAYAYDARNELTGLSQSGTAGSGVANELARLTYDNADRMTGLTRYSDLAGTTTVATTAYAYDGADRLTTLTHQTAAAAVVARYGYTLDAASRLTQEARTWTTPGGASATDTVGYGYTDDNQLTSATHSNAAFAGENFGYDANGNRNTAGYATAAGNRQASDGTSTYAYDDQGNQLSKTAIATGNQTTYQWDFRNRLVEVDGVVGGVTTVVARYTYDALNRPIKIVEGGATRQTLYDGQTPLLDFDGWGAVTARYLSVPGAIDELLARQTASGVAWYLDDRERTVRDIVNNAGAVIDHVDYGSFGGVTAESSPSSGDRFKYAGMELDAATGLDYDRARYYDAATGRFIGQDPIGLAAGDDNLYRYVANNIDNMTDRTGLQGLGIRSPGGGIGTQAGSAALQGVTPTQQVIAYWMAKEAEKYQKTYPNGDYNTCDMQGAARHAYWSALMAWGLGDKAATAVGDAHEAASNDPADTARDQYNNQVGRDIGNSLSGLPTDTPAGVILTLIQKEIEDAFCSGKLVFDKNDPRLNPRKPLKPGPPAPEAPIVPSDNPLINLPPPPPPGGYPPFPWPGSLLPDGWGHEYDN